MPFSCAVYGCKGNYKSGPRVSIFKFPEDPELAKMWTLRCRRKNFTPSKYARICELHFHKDDIIREISGFDEKNNRLITCKLQSPRMRKGAVPLNPLATPESDNTEGQPSKDPSDPDYVPSVFDTSSKNTSSRKALATPSPYETVNNEAAPVWTSLLQLQPITSEAGTSGLSGLPPLLPKPEKPSPKAGIWKNKSKSKGKSRKKLRSPSPTLDTPAEGKLIDPLKLCVVKMEIEDDGYTQNEEDNFLASLTPSTSSQNSQSDTVNIPFGSVTSIKTEPNQEIVPTIYTLVPTTTESTNPPSNSTQQDVEAFFKNVAQTVMQLPPHLIEETKTKVSALVYDMVIQAMSQGCTTATQHTL